MISHFLNKFVKQVKDLGPALAKQETNQPKPPVKGARLAGGMFYAESDNPIRDAYNRVWYLEEVENRDVCLSSSADGSWTVTCDGLLPITFFPKGGAT